MVEDLVLEKLGTPFSVRFREASSQTLSLTVETTLDRNRFNSSSGRVGSVLALVLHLGQSRSATQKAILD